MLILAHLINLDIRYLLPGVNSFFVTSMLKIVIEARHGRKRILDAHVRCLRNPTRD